MELTSTFRQSSGWLSSKRELYAASFPRVD